MMWRQCLRFSWEWPLVWKKTAVRMVNDARVMERSRVDNELRSEREQLQKLIPKVVRVGERNFGDNGVYEIRTTLDGGLFYGLYDERERRYFAEYVGREVEANVARLIVVKNFDRPKENGRTWPPLN